MSIASVVAWGVLPHPNPLPLGEGAIDPALERIEEPRIT